MKKKRTDLSPLGWTLLAGGGALAIYLLLRPSGKPTTMVPTVDLRMQPTPVANLLRSE